MNIEQFRSFIHSFIKDHIDEISYKKVSNGCMLDNNYDSDYVLFYYKDNLISIYKSVENKKIKPFIMI